MIDIGSRVEKRTKGVTPSDAIFKNIRCVTNGLPNDGSSEPRVFWVHETKAHAADAHAERPRAPGAVESFGWRPMTIMEILYNIICHLLSYGTFVPVPRRTAGSWCPATVNNLQ